MKLKHAVVVSIAAASCLVLQAGAAETNLKLPNLGSLQKADEIIGMEIQNPQDQKLGKVKDLAIDMDSGRIVAVLISSGGLAGVGDRIVAAPPAAFTFEAAKKMLWLRADQEKLKAAPEFNLSKWEESVQSARVAEVYRYFGQQPYFVAESNPGTTRRAAGNLGHLDRASTVIGLPVKNIYAEKLGKVENLILDLGNGRVAEVIISSGGFLGLGDELSVVPPRAFHFNLERDTLSLNTTKEELKNAPHFKSSEWPDLSQPSYIGGVYSAYHIEPYFSTSPTSDRLGLKSAAINQGNSPGDLDRTARIRKEVLAGKNLSINARNVKIITVDGRVTLRGPVDTQAEKNLIGDIAIRIAQAENVDNQLEVRMLLPTGRTE